MTESKFYPGSLQIPPMKYCAKASEAQAEQAWASGDWLMQEKKDGALYQLEKTDEGYLYLFSRTVSKKTGELAEKLENFPQIQEWGEKLPNGTIVVGEVYLPGGKSNDVTRLTGCLPAKAIARQFDEAKADIFLGPAHYYVFDCLRYDGELIADKPAIERLNDYLGCEMLDLFNDEEYVEIAEVYESRFAERLQEIFSEGGEGAVFKNKNVPYKIGKRSTVKEAFKWKTHLDSLDLVCMELLDPVKEYTGKGIDTWPYWEGDIAVTKPYALGWKNAMRLGAYKNGELVEVCRVASGLTDALREDMANQPEAYLGKVIEIECMSVNKKDGTVRHPCFKNIRLDKDAADCLWEDIFEN